MALCLGPVGDRIRPFAVRKVEVNHLYMKQDGKDIGKVSPKLDDFRKTDASGRGYQPMILRTQTAQITEEIQLVPFLPVSTRLRKWSSPIVWKKKS